MEYLIDMVDVNKVDTFVDPELHCACRSGRLDIVEYLIEHKAGINLLSASKESPMYCAAANKHLAIVKYLVQHDADMEQELQIAVHKGCEEIVQHLSNFLE